MIAPRVFPPLFAPQRVLPGSPEAAVIERLAPFFHAGVFASVDLHVVAQLGRRVGVLDPDVLLAVALAVRAPRYGHICVDLHKLAIEDLLPPVQEGQSQSGGSPPCLPGDGWLPRVRAATQLVRDAQDAGRIAPFVLDGTVLYTDRYHRYQVDLAERVRRWSGAEGLFPVDPRDLSHLDQALDALFRPPADQPDGPGALNLQRVAGAVALTRRYAVITGGPGMGKTWTVRNLLALLHLRHQRRHERGETERPELAVALAAPTGKAAARMREALRDGLAQDFEPKLEGVIGAAQITALSDRVRALEARTLHRLLGFRYDAPTRFRHDRLNPLPYDVIVVDEASMVDFPMMAKLVDAVGERGPAGEPTRLILLGDRHQLASVEAGTVLADLCGPTQAARLEFTEDMRQALERFPCLGDLGSRKDPSGRTVVSCVQGPPAHDAVVQFNRTFRFDEKGGIGAFASACLLPPERFDAAAVVDGLAAGGAEDSRGRTSLLSYREQGELPASLGEILLEGYRPYLELLRQGWAGPSREHPTQEVFHRCVLEAFGRFRVLCAHRRGRSGVQGFNEHCVSLLRGRGLISPSGQWWLGRPVLVLRNDYGVRRSGGGRGLFNGDIGLMVYRIVDGERRRMVAFPGPDSLPSVGGWGGLDPSGYVGRSLTEYVEPARLPEHATVFAMTIHKSQGSEFDRVLCVLPAEGSRILTRELIYTGVTRARRGVTVLAERGVLESALGDTVGRASGLEGAVWGEGGA
jgi:exodeoxyribonuclease V alpha subunit